jgi:bla regulator protein blaR1
MIKFLIESSICLTLFYGVYWFFLRKEKFFGLNRYYLIGAVLLSVLIPLLEFSFTASWAVPVQAATNIFPSDKIASSEIVDSTTTTNFLTLSNLYLAGVMISALMLMLRFYFTIKKSGLKLSLKRRGIQVVSADGYQAFSFLNTIVLGTEIVRNPELKKTIMLHEMAHVQGRHSIDLLIMEILKCFYWFNPFIYLAIKSLKIQHEYIADAHVLEQVSPTAYERSLATITLAKIDHRLVHAFGRMPLENRIKMIYNTNSNVMNKLKLLFVLPIVALLLFQFSCTEDGFGPEEVEVLAEEMSVTLERTVHGMNISLDGKATRNDEKFRVHGIVKDAAGLVLGGVKVSASESGIEAISDDDGTFSLMVTSEDKELMLDHPEKRSNRINLTSSFAPAVIDMVEIPDDLHLNLQDIQEKIRQFDGVLIERAEKGVKIDPNIEKSVIMDLYKEKAAIEELIYEERAINPRLKNGQMEKEVAKARSIMKKRENKD